MIKYVSSFYIPKYNCVFIHIPKTAGSSIRNGFFQGEYIGAYHRYPFKYKNLFSFCFVRNPYDRLISAYNFFHKKKLETIKYNSLQLNFNDFLDIVINESIDYTASSIHTNPHSFIRHHTIPQTHYFNQLSYAKFIGRYENLEEDWRYICQQINAVYQPLPQNNASHKQKLSWYEKTYQKWFPRQFRIKLYKKYFNNHTLAIINRYYAQDFDVLNYNKMEVLA